MKNRNQKTVCEKKTFRTLKVKELERVIGGCPQVIIHGPEPTVDSATVDSGVIIVGN
jgi:hypothetical protein